MRLSSCVPLLALCVLTGCATHPAREAQAGEEIVLSNGEVEAVVVPRLARIMSFREVGGRNLLWINPAADGSPQEFGGWRNFGGEKAWVWPQDDWKSMTGTEWPPPGDRGDVAYHVKRFEPKARRVTLVSGPIPGIGVRIERTISLPERGRVLRIETTLRAANGATTRPVSPWSVTQTTIPPHIVVHETPHLTQRIFFGETLREIGRDGATTLASDVTQHTKIGFDAQHISVPLDGRQLHVRSVDHSPGEFRAGEQAQLYRPPASSATTGPAAKQYLEIEFTAPLAPANSSPSLTVELEIR